MSARDMTPRHSRVEHDVSTLPDVVFGARDLMWWGTLGFVVIEGFTLVLCAAAYVYFHENFATWPPENTPLPSLGVPSLHVLVMLASLPLVRWLDVASKQFDLGKVRVGLSIASVYATVFVAFRLVELLVSLNVKWNANAYGSAQWLVLGAHGTLLLFSAGEIIGMCAMFWLAPVERRHFSDVSDAMLYWAFMVFSWIPLYLLCFLLPRWI